MRFSANSLSAEGPIALGYRLGHIQTDSRIFRGIVYNKSALVLHMLRRLVGDEAFFRATRRFYEDYTFKKAGTEDFRRVFQAETSLPMDRFVSRWILGAALPRLRVTWRLDPTGEGAERAAVVRIEQVGEVFDLPYTVTVQYADGKSTPVTLAIHEAVKEYRVPLTGPVRRIDTRDELFLGALVK
jgi:aminopeptidase N